MTSFDSEAYKVVDKEVYRLLDGSEHSREGWPSRGIFLEECQHLLPPHVSPLVQNERWNVRQDAEYPVPGFYIVGCRPQEHSITNLSEDDYIQFSTLLRATREEMRKQLGIDRVNIYLEEKIDQSHLHIWLMPLWQDVLDRTGLKPRVCEGNIREYLQLFSFEEEGDRILEYNARMSGALKNRPELMRLGFH